MIAPELVLTVPMASRTGFVTYLDYTAGSKKGGVNRGDLFNGTYALGEMTDERVAYTGNAVVESFTTTSSSETVTCAWTPVYGTIAVTDASGNALVEGTDYTIGSAANVDKRWTKDTVDGATSSSALLTNSVDVAPNAIPAGGKEVTITFANAGDYKVKYLYDNIVIPQNDIPQLNAELKEITLTARARRIAVDKYAA